MQHISLNRALLEKRIVPQPRFEARPLRRQADPASALLNARDDVKTDVGGCLSLLISNAEIGGHKRQLF
jgi:hypothetical protein